VNGELGGMWKEVVMVYFKVLYKHLHRVNGCRVAVTSFMTDYDCEIEFTKKYENSVLQDVLYG
jgi:hypothetical protein